MAALLTEGMRDIYYPQDEKLRVAVKRMGHRWKQVAAEIGNDKTQVSHAHALVNDRSHHCVTTHLFHLHSLSVSTAGAVF